MISHANKIIKFSVVENQVNTADINKLKSEVLRLTKLNIDFQDQIGSLVQTVQELSSKT